MGSQEDSESKRLLLKPGDFGMRTLRPNPFYSAMELSDRSLCKPSISISNKNQSMAYPRSNTPTETPYSHFFHSSRAAESQYLATFSPQLQQAADISQQIESAFSSSNLLPDKRLVFKSESETTLNSLYSRSMQPGNQCFELSVPSSPDSEDCLTFRSAADRQVVRRTFPICPCNTTSTQTERSPFEEKFLFRESILLGCDLVAQLTDKLPALADLREHAQFIREKTIQSRAQNICSRLVHKSEEPQIIAEYVKSFFRIADSWLDARNCFGTSDQCSNEICSLDTKDLTNNYVEWMHVSRQLLNSIVKGLESVAVSGENVDESIWMGKGTVPCSRAGGVNASDQHQGTWPAAPAHRATSDFSGAGTNWSYPSASNPPCYCAPTNPQIAEEVPPRIQHRNYPQNEQPPRFQSNPPNLYPNLRMYPGNDSIDTSNDDYLKPSSYDVPRTNIPPAQMRNNISKAKSTCFQDKATGKGYVIVLAGGGNKRDDNFDARECNGVLENEDTHLKTADGDPKDGVEWMPSNERSKNNAEADGDGDVFLDSDSQGSAKEQKSDNSDGLSFGRNGKSVKSVKSTVRIMKRRLSHKEQTSLQGLVQELWTCDVPDFTKYAVKNTQQYYKVVRHPIFLETISNKLKHGVYETLEQFVHDGRRLVTNSLLFSQKESVDSEKVSKFEQKFESLLNDRFDRYTEWAHITGDSKEVSNFPELKSAAARKRTKLPKILQPTETSKPYSDKFAQ